MMANPFASARQSLFLLRAMQLQSHNLSASSSPAGSRRCLSSAKALYRATLDASKVVVNQVSSRKAYPPPEQLIFGKTFTDHMLTVEWDEKSGWGSPEIKPYQPLNIDPAASVLHYAFECFEGMKAFKDTNGEVRLFRPDKNMERFSTSGARIALPDFDKEELLNLIRKFVDVERDTIPQLPGYSLYLRPTFIGTNAELGVKYPSKAMIFVIASPVGPYYPRGFQAVRLLATDDAVRAWPGGVGNKKLGANYAPTVQPQRLAAAEGYEQILWLFGEDGIVTEAGTMNAFFVFKDAAGKKELVTCPLDGTILEGVTRDSILSLARERLDPASWTVTERYYTINEVLEKSKNGQLVEAFGAGTAAVVSPIKEIGYKNESINVPLQEGKEAGELTETVAKWIMDIQYGKESHGWAPLIPKSE